jgi:hypothetical protein
MDTQQLNYYEALAEKELEIQSQKLAEELENMKRNKDNFFKLLGGCQYTKFYYGICNFLPSACMVSDLKLTLGATCTSEQLPDLAGRGKFQFTPDNKEINNWDDFWKMHNDIKTIPDAVSEIRIVEIVPRNSITKYSFRWTFLKEDECMKITILNCMNGHIEVEYL